MKNNWRKDKQRSFNRLFVEVFYDLSERFSAHQQVSTRCYSISSRYELVAATDMLLKVVIMSHKFTKIRLNNGEIVRGW